MAVKVQFLDVGARQFPVDKYFTFGNGSYLFRFRKNVQAEVPFYTVEIFSANGKKLLFANQLVYGQNAIDSLLAPFRDKIIPLNIDYEATGVGADYLNDETLGKDVLLVTGITET
jgi:hypothetical protein